MRLLTKFKLNLICVFFLKIRQNRSSDYRPGNGGTSAEQEQIYPGQGRLLMSLLAAFELNRSAVLPENVRPLLETSKARKLRKFRGA